jgi:RNA polymerase primary sigma factor
MSDQALNDYLTAIGKIPLLTTEEEIFYGRDVQLWIADRESTSPCPRIERRGKRATRRMVQGNLRLVVTVSTKFYNRASALTRMDLIQEGNLGLIRAVEKFDPSRGYKFSTYAYWWIRQGMSRAISQSDRMIRLPMPAGDILSRVRRFASDYRGEHGVAPSLEQCAKVAGIVPDTLALYLSHAAGHASIDALAKSQGDADGCAIIDLLPSNATNTVEDAWESMELDRLEVLLEALTEAEYDVLDQTYGLSTGSPKTLEAVGKEKGVSRERVRQIKERALMKVRARGALSPLLA